MSIPQLIGQDSINEFITRSLATGQLPHAIIISGIEKGGKFAIANYIANNISSDPDIKVIDFPDKEPKYVETIREQLVDNLYFRPYRNDQKVYIIRRADSMTKEAQNALLKSLEEPPEYATIILLCENSQKLVATIRSRTVLLSIKPVALDLIIDFLMKEKNADRERAQKAAMLSEGNIERAEYICNSEDYIEKVERIGEIISLLCIGRDKIPLDFSEDIKAFSEDLGFFLEIAELFLRDALVYKLAKEQKMIYNGWQESIVALCRSQRGTEADLGKIQKRIKEVRKALNHNVSAKNLLDTLFYDMT